MRLLQLARRRAFQAPVILLITMRRYGLRVFRYITEPLTCSQRGHQPSPTGLTASKTNLASSPATQLYSAWKRAQDRSKWRELVETAVSCQGRATCWWGLMVIVMNSTVLLIWIGLGYVLALRFRLLLLLEIASCTATLTILVLFVSRLTLAAIL